MTFALNPELDVADLARRFAAHGRVTIPALLDPACALALARCLIRRQDWKQALNDGERALSFDAKTIASRSEEEHARIEAFVRAGARDEFQYRFRRIIIAHDAASMGAADEGDLLGSFAGWWNTPPVLQMFAEIIGAPQTCLADAHASRFDPGDLLTGHDDQSEPLSRHAAYVLNLSPVWKLDWGGLLIFHRDDGRAGDIVVPVFNQLTLFRVGLQHSVSEVCRHAAGPRLSITGWFRSTA